MFAVSVSCFPLEKEDLVQVKPMVTHGWYPWKLIKHLSSEDRMILSKNITWMYFSTFKIATHTHFSSIIKPVKLFPLLATCSKQEPYHRREKSKMSYIFYRQTSSSIIKDQDVKVNNLQHYTHWKLILFPASKHNFGRQFPHQQYNTAMRIY